MRGLYHLVEVSPRPLLQPEGRVAAAGCETEGWRNWKLESFTFTASIVGPFAGPNNGFAPGASQAATFPLLLK